MADENPNQSAPRHRDESAVDELSEGRPHKPADDREEIYFEGTPMLRGEMGQLIFWTVLGLLFIAAPFVARYVFDRNVYTWAWIASIVIGLVLLVVPHVFIRSRRYRITNYRIDYERGIFSKRIDTLELWHVDDIQFHQSLLDRLFNVGSVIVMSHDDTTPKLELDGLPNPRTIFESLKQRVISVKRQRGVIKMDTN